MRDFIVIYEGKNQSKNIDKLSNKVELEGRTKEYKLCIRAHALRLKKEYELSVFTYLDVLKTDKNNEDAIKGIAFCYAKMNDYKKSLKYYDMLRKLTPFDKSVYYELGICSYNIGNYCDCINYLIKAIKLCPEYYDAIYILAQAHEALNEYEMAEMIYLKIINERPSYIMAYNKLAELYMNLEEFQKAIGVFYGILDINPEFYKGYLGIALAYDKMKDDKRAIKYYKKYLELKPFSKERKYIQARFKELRPVSIQENVKFLNIVK